MKRTIVILLIAVVALCGLLFRHIIALDGLVGLIWSCADQDTTAYTDGYSHSAFRRIHAGMPQSDLIALMGEPIIIWSRDPGISSVTNRQELRASPNNTYIWDYSRSTNSPDYRMRQVSVKNEIVVGRHSEYWVD